MLGLWAKETPEASVGKIFVSSILPEIHRCISVIYSWAGSSTGSLRLFSQVKEWCLQGGQYSRGHKLDRLTYRPADMRGHDDALQMD